MQYSVADRPRFFFIASTFLIVAALYLARDILVPLALSILLSFVLGPLVTRIERLGLRRVPSVLAVALLSFAMIGASGYMFTQQLATVAHDVPRYSDNLKQKIKSLKPSRKSVISELQETVQEINKEIVGPTQPPPVTASAKAEAAKAELEARSRPSTIDSSRRNEPSASGLTLIGVAIAPILAPLATAGIVAICVIFMLIHREDLRDRVIRLIGEGRITVTTEALDEAAVKVSTYLSALLLVNVSFGIAVACGLYLIGVPNAFLWGFLGAILRFIPYLGATIAAALPIVLSIATTPGWGQPLYVLGLFVALEMTIANFVEPLVFSHGTGLSPIAVLGSALFWTWIWGAIGLLLATPITVCLVVIGKYVPALEFISILFGDKPALQPHVRLYQRLLASDREEALDIVREILKLQPIDHLYQEVLLPILALAERDRVRGRVDEEKEQAVRSSLREIIAEAEEVYERSRKLQEGATASVGDATSSPQLDTPHDARTRALIIPARSDADEISALLLSHLFRHRGIVSEVAAGAIALKEFDHERGHATVAIISAMSPPTIGNARLALRRIRGSEYLAGVIVGLWNEAAAWERTKERLSLGEDVRVVTSLTAALERSVQSLTTSFSSADGAADRQSGHGSQHQGGSRPGSGSARIPGAMEVT